MGGQEWELPFQVQNQSIDKQEERNVSFDVVSSLKTRKLSKAFPNTVLFFSQICLYSFPSIFSIQEISLWLSRTFICLSCSLNRKVSDSVLGTSFLSHVFSRTGSLQDNFKNKLFHIAAILFTGLNLSGFLLVPHCNSDLVPVSLQVSLEFAAWVSRCGGCAQAKYPVGFLNRPLVVTFDLQGLR